MGIITMIIIGLIAGAIARLLVPGRQRIGWLATIIVGIVGSYVGGALGSLVFAPHVFSVHPPVHHLFLGSIVGAVIVLLIYGAIRARV
jgi:uncharacterized membrane protein YeaQ/YmgE (transglycosylase-associated protein family)